MPLSISIPEMPSNADPIVVMINVSTANITRKMNASKLLQNPTYDMNGNNNCSRNATREAAVDVKPKAKRVSNVGTLPRRFLSGAIDGNNRTKGLKKSGSPKGRPLQVVCSPVLIQPYLVPTEQPVGMIWLTTDSPAAVALLTTLATVAVTWEPTLSMVPGRERLRSTGS